MGGSSTDFARAFGDALKAHLDEHGVTYTKAAACLGVTKSALSTYWTDDADGNRRKPRAEVLFLACKELEFTFEYRGYRVTAGALGKPREGGGARSEQLRLDFSRQFKLTEDDGQVSVNLQRRPGHIEFSVLLKAVS